MWDVWLCIFPQNSVSISIFVALRPRPRCWFTFPDRWLLYLYLHLSYITSKPIHLALHKSDQNSTFLNIPSPCSKAIDADLPLVELQQEQQRTWRLTIRIFIIVCNCIPEVRWSGGWRSQKMGRENIFCVDLQQPSLTQVPLWHSTAGRHHFCCYHQRVIFFAVAAVVIIVAVVVLTSPCHRCIAIVVPML